LLQQGKTGAAIGSMVLCITAFGLSAYFVFAAVQGDYGHFRRVQIEADESALKVQLAQLHTERAILQNKTRRLSDTFLDLDLLDERARKVLGMARGDEILIQ
jgi:cell division protein FtsB